MAELKWLDGYEGQSVDELIALKGKYRTDSLVLAFQKWEQGDGENMSEEEMVIITIEAMEREVNNGGWGQFFVNAGHFAPVIVDALKRIKCTKTEKIARRALEVVKKTPITKKEIENGTWEDHEERQAEFEKCDSRYFERDENIEESLFAFIVANRSKIDF
jgi:hypothetical protein